MHDGFLPNELPFYQTLVISIGQMPMNAVVRQNNINYVHSIAVFIPRNLSVFVSIYQLSLGTCHFATYDSDAIKLIQYCKRLAPHDHRKQLRRILNSRHNEPTI